MNLYTNESRNTEMKKKLEAIIEVGRLNAVNVMEKIQKEVPQDRIVKASVLDFEPDENGIFVMLPGERDVIHATPVREQLHRNALGQMMERANVPMEFATVSPPKAHGGTRSSPTTFGRSSTSRGISAT